MATKRPATSGTRRGNGAGWGGPASGKFPTRGATDKGGRPLGVKNGEGKKAQAQAALEEAAPTAAAMVIEIAKDRADPRALQAATAILNRVGLHEKAGIEHSGEVAFNVVTGVERAED